MLQQKHKTLVSIRNRLVPMIGLTIFIDRNLLEMMSIGILLTIRLGG